MILDVSFQDHAIDNTPRQKIEAKLERLNTIGQRTPKPLNNGYGEVVFWPLLEFHGVPNPGKFVEVAISSAFAAS
jgi:hypothetical protein